MPHDLSGGVSFTPSPGPADAAPRYDISCTMKLFPKLMLAFCGAAIVVSSMGGVVVMATEIAAETAAERAAWRADRAAEATAAGLRDTLDALQADSSAAAAETRRRLTQMLARTSEPAVVNLGYARETIRPVRTVGLALLVIPFMLALGNWNFIIGFSLIVIGLLMTMRWR